jgi:hypothetical protein
MKQHHEFRRTILAVILVAAACGSKDNPDRDGDGVPNGEDAFPDDPQRFSRYTTLLLDGLAGGTFGAAAGINAANEVVGLSQDQAGTLTAVKWTVTGSSASAASPLASLVTGGYGAAYAINEEGVAVGESQRGSSIVAVTWPTGTTAPTELSRAGFEAPSAAYGIAGTRVVGEASREGNAVAVLWASASEVPVALGTLGGPTSAAYAINGAGLVVGESVDASGEARGALWKLDAAGVPSAPVALAPLDGHVASVALGVNAAGEIAGESESAAGEVHAVLWKLDAAGAPGAPIDLGVGSATGINASSRVAGYRAEPSQASAWDGRNTSMAESIVTGSFTSTQAYDLNDSHTVVGRAEARGFVAVPQ